MASLSLRHIYKKYPGGVTAVSDFNLEIKDKEFIVLVGPSGCGKSTTLRMIAGLEEISEGELFIGDRLVNDVAPKDRKIAMVFQNYALYPHMTVSENMAFGLKLNKTPKEEIMLDALDGTAYLDIKYEEDFDGAAGHSFEGGRYFTASIVQIKEENLARDFVGISYVTLTLADGETVTLYSDAAVANATATAEAALTRTDVEWTDAQTEILEALSGS